MADGWSRRRALLGGLAVAALPGAARAEEKQLMAPMPGRKPAPDFTLPNLDDEMVTLSALRGRIVIVNFWATWCPPCRFEIPSMQRAWNQVREEGIVLLAVHVGGNVDQVTNFTFDYDVDFPVVMVARSEVIKQWPVLGLPTTVVVDREGLMVLRAIGSREWDDPAILAQIRSM